MKARIKATGEIVEVEFEENILEKDVFCAMYRIVGTDTIYPYNTLEIIHIDWEQRTWDAAVAAIRGIALSADEFTDKEIETISYNAITLAKALVAEYRKGE